MLAGCMVMIVAIMWLFPDTELARLLHKHLVEGPERWMANATRADILYFFVLLIMCVTAGEMVMMFGADFLFAYSWDLTLYFDGMIASLAVAAVSRLTSVARAVVRRLPVGLTRANRRTGRAARSQRHKTPSRSANDDDGHGFALAA